MNVTFQWLLLPLPPPPLPHPVQAMYPAVCVTSQSQVTKH